MKQEYSPTRLDVRSFAQDGASLEGQDPLRNYARLLGDSPVPGLASPPVRWNARGELRAAPGGPEQVWLHLSVDAVLPMTCQRCLSSMDVPLQVRRAFRFVADEKTAQALDDEIEEDLLVLSRSFDLAELIEDELLMEMPAAPRHEACPTDVKLAVADEGFDAPAADTPHPFAALQKLKSDKGN